MAKLKLVTHIKGIPELRKRLNNLEKDATIKTKFAVAKATQNIQLKAVLIVPVKKGKLKQSIKSKYDKGGLIGRISATEDYAPYVEFGTGQFVKVPKGFDEMAMSFFVNGKGKMKPRPFLIPSWASEVPIFKADLKKIIKDLKL
jgi:HK97 gp10 family phage protein